MTSDYKKPLPLPYADSRPFWDSVKEHQMKLQRCNVTGKFFFPPAPVSPWTLTDNFEWVPVSGRATLYTWTVHQRPNVPSFKEDVPYNTAIVELEEGVRMMTSIKDCAPDQLTMGMPLELVYDDVTEAVSLPKFRPAGR